MTKEGKTTFPDRKRTIVLASLTVGAHFFHGPAGMYAAVAIDNVVISDATEISPAVPII